MDIWAVRTDSNFGMLRLEISDACLPFHLGKICDRPRTSKVDCPIREFPRVTLHLRNEERNSKEVTFFGEGNAGYVGARLSRPGFRVGTTFPPIPPIGGAMGSIGQVGAVSWFRLESRAGEKRLPSRKKLRDPPQRGGNGGRYTGNLPPCRSWISGRGQPRARGVAHLIGPDSFMLIHFLQA